MKLTQHQISALTEGKKHWSLKKKHLIGLCKSWGIIVSEAKADGFLEWLFEMHIPREKKRLAREYFEKTQSGKIKNNLTPTDVKGDFVEVTNPKIGGLYHISWAFSGAYFRLVRIEGEIAYMDNPKHKRRELLKCKVSELRSTRKNQV